MSMILCDYQAESSAAAQMADAAMSEMDRSDWLFLAFAWQALARSHNNKGDSLDPDLHTDAGAETHSQSAANYCPPDASLLSNAQMV